MALLKSCVTALTLAAWLAGCTGLAEFHRTVVAAGEPPPAAPARTVAYYRHQRLLYDIAGRAREQRIRDRIHPPKQCVEVGPYFGTVRIYTADGWATVPARKWGCTRSQ